MHFMIERVQLVSTYLELLYMTQDLCLTHRKFSFKFSKIVRFEKMAHTKTAIILPQINV